MKAYVDHFVGLSTIVSAVSIQCVYLYFVHQLCVSHDACICRTTCRNQSLPHRSFNSVPQIECLAYLKNQESACQSRGMSKYCNSTWREMYLWRILYIFAKNIVLLYQYYYWIIKKMLNFRLSLKDVYSYRISIENFWVKNVILGYLDV